MTDLRHAFTVDVEDWHNATILQYSGMVVPPGEAVVRNGSRLLELCARYGVLGTWFFLGEVAAAFPELVRAVADAGHEVGVHGYHHHQVSDHTRAEYRESIGRAKAVVEHAGGVRVLGYRAVDFSIDRTTWWALDELADLGFLYDASLFPMRMPRYGVSGVPLDAHWIRTEGGRWIFEIPMTIGRIGTIPVPFSGGGYFRLLPYSVCRWMLRRHSRQHPAVFYVHPCEIEQKSRLELLPAALDEKIKGQIQRAFKSQSRGRDRGDAKLSRLFSDFQFGPLREVFAITDAEPPDEPPAD